jgi:hypothetical protein
MGGEVTTNESQTEARLDAGSEETKLAKESGIRELSAGSTAGMEADLALRGNKVRLSVTGPAVAGALSAMSGISVLTLGHPLADASHFWLVMLSSLVVGGTLSLLLTNSRITDFRERIEDYRSQLHGLRSDIERREARLRLYEDAVMNGQFKARK